MYRSERVKIMRRDAGLVYVYRSYGVHACFNVVAKPPGATGAVLMRAVEPTQGLELMAQRRGTEKRQLLCSGPGRLCQAFGIGLDDHGRDITEDADFWLEGREAEPVVMAGPRVGITRAVDLPWRFFEADSPFVSHRRVGRRTLVSEAAS
jgi:DNA-3-methyladenine glycosylase